MRSGKEPGPVDPIPVHTTEEVGQVAHAVDELHEQAVFLAGEQSRLQLQVGDMFETLSRRSRSLVDQQLSLIDRLERNEEDPDRLESLFRLDHLAARMRRNGANLLVLAGAKVPREQTDPVPVAAIVNAAASEVEDYTRVVTATVPDSEIVGSVAGDLVHLLAELLDNALRYSPPISQVRVSAVHTGNGGLVIEVSDIGLGMTESDLRVANTRLQSGGEVTPYTARHMGLFVVGRLAQQHGLVVRSAQHHCGRTEFGHHGRRVRAVRADRARRYARPDRHRVARSHPRRALRHRDGTGPRRGRHADYDEYGDEVGVDQLNGHSEVPVTLLPQRSPGASGISDSGADAATRSCRRSPTSEPEHEYWDEPGRRRVEAGARSTPPAFFASRAQASSNGVHAPQHEAEAEAEPEEPAGDRRDWRISATAGADDAIYQKMLSEWLVDPTELANSSDLNWESVWDHGWSAAEAAEDAPVASHTEQGLPVRDPGARLVPGAAADPYEGANGGHSQRGSAPKPRGRRRGRVGGRIHYRRTCDSGTRSGRRSREHQQPFRRRACRAVRTPERPEEQITNDLSATFDAA